MRHKLLLTLFLMAYSVVLMSNEVADLGDWKVTYITTSKSFKLQYQMDGALRIVLNANIPHAKYTTAKGETREVTIKNFAQVEVQEADMEDELGKGCRQTFLFSQCDNGDDIQMLLHFTSHEEVTYLLMSLELQSMQEISSNQLSPVKISNTYTLLTKSANNRMLKVPYDNDGFVRYGRMRLNTTITSYEVTALYQGDIRRGIVIGSIDHDHWKSAITMTGLDDSKLNNMEVTCGVTGGGTHDILPHGSLYGTSICSSRFLIGYFHDWREGMEIYADACTAIAPKRDNWDQGRPVGWMSWNVLETKNNQTDDAEIMKYFAQTLRPAGFHNGKGDNFISLDSWSNLNENQERYLIAQAEKYQQMMSCYGTPFCLWWSENDMNQVYYQNGSTTYRGRDVVLKANGKPISYDGAFCVDPTHPGFRAFISSWIKQQYNKGFRAFKLDFLTNGMMQADSYYDSKIHTGVEAYNQGMAYLTKKVNELKEPVFLLLSIAPLFPHQYANARRQACDSWGTIGWTEYSMNAITAGWWTDRLYQFNDPDGIPLVGEGDQKSTTLAENRARLTSGIVSGMVQLADNFSLKNVCKRGDPQLSRSRAETLLQNPDINAMLALDGKSFRPVYGFGEYNNSEGAEATVMLNTEEYVYLAIFNYNNNLSTPNKSGTVKLADLGLTQDDFLSVKELWTGEEIDATKGIRYSIPPRDARIYRFALKPVTGIKNLHEKPSLLTFTKTANGYALYSRIPIAHFNLFTLQGQHLQSFPVHDYRCQLSLPNSHGVFILQMEYETGKTESAKLYR